MLTTELIKRQQQALTLVTAEDPFIFSPQLVEELQLRNLAREIITLAERLKPSLPAGAGGAPQTYPEESILVTIMVMSVW
ncbi:MAG: hypothetical protein KDJ65_02415 [Anaerolineae bacterium]|nr:hypothetical protein [Anaerolineae bacterium]